MQDHFLRSPGVSLHSADDDERTCQQPAARAIAMAQYVLFRSGPLAGQRGHRWGLCAQRYRAWNGPTCNSIFPRSAMPRATGPARSRIRFPGFSLSAVHLRPDAAARVLIKSSDPLAPPAIKFNFLQTPS